MYSCGEMVAALDNVANTASKTGVSNFIVKRKDAVVDIDTITRVISA